MTQYLISTDVKQANNAGYKAKQDIVHIMDNCVSIYIPSKLRIMNSLYYLTIGIKKLFLPIKEGDAVIVQFPLEGFYPLSVLWMKAVYKQLSLKKAHIITIIHDLDGLRYDDNKKKQNDVDILNYSDDIIVHSEAMKKWLIDAGVKKNMVILEMFDYLTDDYELPSDIEKKIVFAGNLNKSLFLKQETLFDLDVFGPCNFVDQLPKNIQYCGSVSPNALVQHISKYAFGLVWDGESLDEISGNTGNYLKYNAPHKFSLYLAAGVPVITWKEAAIAKVIEKYQLGIVVESLNDLPEKLNQLTTEDYNIVKNHVKKIQTGILQGNSIKKSLDQLGVK